MTRRGLLYQLIDRVVVSVPGDDFATFARAMAALGEDGKVVARSHAGPVFVSTVFLGINHQHYGDGPPLVFETMLFNDGEPYGQGRTSTWPRPRRCTLR